MLFLPLAHQAGATALGKELSAYALPDGTLPVICTINQDPTKAPRGRTSVCDACILFAAPGLLASADIVTGLPFVLPLRLGRKPELVFGERLYLISAAQPRGPPSISA